MPDPARREGRDARLWSLLNRLLGKGAAPQQDASIRQPAVAGRDLLEQLENLFQGADDVKIRRITLGEEGAEAAVLYIDGLVDAARIEETLLRPLMSWAGQASPAERRVVGRTPELLAQRVLAASEVALVRDLEEASAALLRGDVVLVLQGDRQGLQITNRGWQSRPIEDPLLEVTIRGPRDGFTENVMWNTALLRRRLRDPSLRVELFSIGRRSRTTVAMLHLASIAPDQLVQEVRRRLNAIDIDGILDTGYIEQLIEDKWWSPLPQHLRTERPDRAAAALLEGRVVIIADTTPFVLVVPATFDSLFHSPEDSYDRWFPVNLLRWVRFLASVLSLIMPGLYVALVAYHPGILPTEFTLRLMASREGVAFPVLVETLLMQFFLELIKEAGFRMPSSIGQTFGIVGGLILGDIGVRAGLVSDAMVIVVAITAVSSFAAVDRELGTVLRLLGLPVLLSAAVLGLYGLTMALLLILAHLCTLRSYGVPYLAPYGFYPLSDWKDSVFRAPLRHYRHRPAYLSPKDPQRMGRGSQGETGGED